MIAFKGITIGRTRIDKWRAFFCDNKLWSKLLKAKILSFSTKYILIMSYPDLLGTWKFGAYPPCGFGVSDIILQVDVRKSFGQHFKSISFLSLSKAILPSFLVLQESLL